VLALPDRPIRTPKAPTSLYEQFQGEWLWVGANIGGYKQPPRNDVTVLTVVGTELQFTQNGRQVSGDDSYFTIDHSKEFAAIDITPRYGGGQKSEAIIKIEGSELTICYSYGPKVTGRPTDFLPGQQSQIYIYRRNTSR